MIGADGTTRGQRTAQSASGAGFRSAHQPGCFRSRPYEAAAWQRLEGVEANCIRLAADDGRSCLLLSDDRILIASGGRLEAEARIETN